MSTTVTRVWPTSQQTAFIDRAEWSPIDLSQFVGSLVQGIPPEDRAGARVVIPAGTMRIEYTHVMTASESALARAAVLRQAVLNALQHEIDGKVTLGGDDLRAVLAQSDALA